MVLAQEHPPQLRRTLLETDGTVVRGVAGLFDAAPEDEPALRRDIFATVQEAPERPFLVAGASAEPACAGCLAGDPPVQDDEDDAAVCGDAVAQLAQLLECCGGQMVPFAQAFLPIFRLTGDAPDAKVRQEAARFLCRAFECELSAITPAPTCSAWACGASWLIRSVGRETDAEVVVEKLQLVRRTVNMMGMNGMTPEQLDDALAIESKADAAWASWPSRCGSGRRCGGCSSPDGSV